MNTRFEQKRDVLVDWAYLETTGNDLYGMKSIGQREIGYYEGCVSWSKLGVWGNICLGEESKCGLGRTSWLGVRQCRFWRKPSGWFYCRKRSSDWDYILAMETQDRSARLEKVCSWTRLDSTEGCGRLGWMEKGMWIRYTIILVCSQYLVIQNEKYMNNLTL